LCIDRSLRLHRMRFECHRDDLADETRAELIGLDWPESVIFQGRDAAPRKGYH